jgi:nucleotide-binding universal stress UspA family protein
MFRDLLVHVDGGVHGRAALRLAIHLAAQTGAKLTGLHILAEPDIPAVYKPSRVDEAVADARLMLDRSAEAARTQFALEAAAHLADSEWLEGRGAVAEGISSHAHFADLVVVSQSEWQSPAERHPLPVAHSVVMQCGRPVLVVPERTPPASFAKVALAWDGSREAVRAIHDAMPFLQAAERVHVLTVQTDHAGGSEAATRMCAHLSHHGVVAESRVEGATVAIEHEVLQASIDRGDYDLLVMGAYSHSRWVEFLFGGATQSTLLTSEIPVLVSH